MQVSSIPAFHRRCTSCERILINTAFRPTPPGALPIGRCRECEAASSAKSKMKKTATTTTATTPTTTGGEQSTD
jgi:hypothetical protein